MILVLSFSLISYRLFSEKHTTSVSNITNLPNFLLQPYSQAEPRVFINRKWKQLPNSQTNTLSEDGQRLAVCGKGGIYIYNLVNDVIDYIYQKDWYPCETITFSDPKTLTVENLNNKEQGERITLNIENKQIIKQSSLTEAEVLNNHNKNFEQRKTNFNKVCNQDNSSCAEITDKKQVILTDRSGTKQTTNINNAIALVGFKQNFIFYATSGNTSSSYLNLIKPASAIVINHYLYAYDIKSGKTENLLKNFRYDYEMLVFF